MSLDRPIILVGTQRSGTTWMGEVFARHPDLAYWVEPRHVWTWGNAYRPDDVLTAEDATERVRRHIERTFAAFVRRRGARRLVEKTPSNCLRLGFIHAVFPDARVVLIVRDGRSVLRSTEEIMRRGVPIHRVVRRAAQTPIAEWPAYAGQAVSAVTRRVTRRRVRFWGPRPPGWAAWLNEESPEVVLARQWVGTIRRAIDDGRALPAENFHSFRYEDLMRRPREVFGRVVEFLSLSNSDGLIRDVAETADARRTDKWKEELSEQTLRIVRPHMEPMLTELGYEW